MRQALQKVGSDWQIPTRVWQQEWVVHSKPVGSGHQALKYLAPYIFRVAIGNRRIQKFENNQVTFRYKASDTGQERLCTLAAEEFIHRFLQHVLPKGFVKVRYFGFFSSGSRKRLSTIKQQLGPVREKSAKSAQTLETAPFSKSVHCSACGCTMRPGNLIHSSTGPAPP